MPAGGGKSGTTASSSSQLARTNSKSTTGRSADSSGKAAAGRNTDEKLEKLENAEQIAANADAAGLKAAAVPQGVKAKTTKIAATTGQKRAGVSKSGSKAGGNKAASQKSADAKPRLAAAPNRKAATSNQNKLDDKSQWDDAKDSALETKAAGEVKETKSESAPTEAEKPAVKGATKEIRLTKIEGWELREGQKITIPENLKITIAPDAEVIPAKKPLTAEQYEELRRLLRRTNLRQLRDMNKDQLKKLVAASITAQRAPTGPSTTGGTNPQATDKPRDPLAKKETKPKTRVARLPRKPREEVAALPAGLTSPFRYKPWTPAFRDRYAALVRPVEVSELPPEGNGGASEQPNTPTAGSGTNPGAAQTPGGNTARSNTAPMNAMAC
jgi:hypothetical protein